MILESFGKKVANKTLDTVSTAQRSKTKETKSRDNKISVACRFTRGNLKVWLTYFQWIFHATRVKALIWESQPLKRTDEQVSEIIETECVYVKELTDRFYFKRLTTPDTLRINLNGSL